MVDEEYEAYIVGKVDQTLENYLVDDVSGQDIVIISCVILRETFRTIPESRSYILKAIENLTVALIGISDEESEEDNVKKTSTGT